MTGPHCGGGPQGIGGGHITGAHMAIGCGLHFMMRLGPGAGIMGAG